MFVPTSGRPCDPRNALRALHAAAALDVLADALDGGSAPPVTTAAPDVPETSTDA